LKLAGQAIDLVVTDWNMPEMNGAELVQVLRSLPQYQEVPIVMVTTRGMQEDVITAMKLGVNGYIIKPFTPEILGEKIKSVMN
jgi:two-component system chemotaxis response regulator CheY